MTLLRVIMGNCPASKNTSQKRSFTLPLAHARKIDALLIAGSVHFAADRAAAQKSAPGCPHLLADAWGTLHPWRADDAPVDKESGAF